MFQTPINVLIKTYATANKHSLKQIIASLLGM